MHGNFLWGYKSLYTPLGTNLNADTLNSVIQ